LRISKKRGEFFASGKIKTGINPLRPRDFKKWEDGKMGRWEN
jgi:hypothetical protein